MQSEAKQQSLVTGWLGSAGPECPDLGLTLVHPSSEKPVNSIQRIYEPDC